MPPAKATKSVLQTILSILTATPKVRFWVRLSFCRNRTSTRNCSFWEGPFWGGKIPKTNVIGIQWSQYILNIEMSDVAKSFKYHCIFLPWNVEFGSCFAESLSLLLYKWQNGELVDLCCAWGFQSCAPCRSGGFSEACRNLLWYVIWFFLILWKEMLIKSSKVYQDQRLASSILECHI